MTLTETMTNERHILVVDDDTGLREQMSAYLREHGYVVHEAGDGLQMAAALEAQPVSLIVLDVMMPGEDGLSICRRLSKTLGASIIMVSALGEEVDRVLGLELGADDYLAKPCSPRELLARVKAVLRRRETPASEGGLTFRFAGFTLNTARRQLRSGDGATIMLTTGEYALLGVFLENPGRILSRDELLEMARGETDVYDRAIDVQVSRLRRKLNETGDGDIIRTYRGAGYMFDARVSRA